MSVTTLVAPVAIVALAVGPSQEAFRAEPQVARKIQKARKAVEEAPTSSEAWGHLGLVLHAHEQNEEAIA